MLKMLTHLNVFGSSDLSSLMLYIYLGGNFLATSCATDELETFPCLFNCVYGFKPTGHDNGQECQKLVNKSATDYRAEIKKRFAD